MRNTSSVFEETTILCFGLQLKGSCFQSGNVPIRLTPLYDGNLLSPEYEKILPTSPALGRLIFIHTYLH
jgi:hypothetical protein